MLHRNCPVCDKKTGEKIEHICMNVPENYRLPDSYNIVVCDNCGMVYADTSASMEDYDWYYTNCNFYGDDSKDDNSERYDWMLYESIGHLVGWCFFRGEMEVAE